MFVNLVFDEYFDDNNSVLEIVCYINMYVIMIEKMYQTLQWCIDFKPSHNKIYASICFGTAIKIILYILVFSYSQENWYQNIVTKILLVISIEKLFDYFAKIKRMYNIINGIMSVVLAILTLMFTQINNDKDLQDHE